MAKLVENNFVDFRRREISVPHTIYKKWLKFSLGERISLNKLIMLSLLYHGHHQTRHEKKEVTSKIAKYNEDIENSKCKKIRIGIPVEVEGFFDDQEEKYKVELSYLLLFYIDKYIDWQIDYNSNNE